MRIIFIVLLSTFINSVSAQIVEGIYGSSISSFRTNYFLKVEKHSVSLLGWETTKSEDTIYFKSTCKNNTSGRLTFTKYAFSNSKNDTSSFSKFVGDPNLNVEMFLLYRYFFNFKVEGNIFTALATKDSYDSRADKFEFLKLK